MSPASARSIAPDVQLQRRIVVSGIGVAISLGNDVTMCWRRLLAGEGGIGRITRFDATLLRAQIEATKSLETLP